MRIVAPAGLGETSIICMAASFSSTALGVRPGASVVSRHAEIWLQPRQAFRLRASRDRADRDELAEHPEDVGRLVKLINSTVRQRTILVAQHLANSLPATPSFAAREAGPAQVFGRRHPRC
jgi:hypothetical protein